MPRKILLSVVLSAFFLSALLLFWHYQLPALAYHWIAVRRQADTWRSRSLWLPDYRVTLDAHPVEGIVRNLSGLTYNSRAGTLFAVINNPAQIAEITTHGQLLRLIAVEGVADLEGISYVDGNLFTLIDEREQQVYWVEIDENTRRVDVAKASRLGLGILLNGNLGFEGVSWDEKMRRLFVAKEKSPMRIFSIDGATQWRKGNVLDLQIREWSPRRPSALFVRDISSISLHDRTGHLLLLSDESRLLVEYGSKSELVSFMPLWRGWHGLKHSIPQAEGVAVDDADAIYIISEPNLLYRFERPCLVNGNPSCNQRE
ncbi:MAG: SdiA-regulated domain-containing protein [Zoogloeaceae bacterium]|nr:SdiA-regulated domain-containing protein [Zoogloeaceae bacterium]